MRPASAVASTRDPFQVRVAERQGKIPPPFALDPSGNYLFVENQNSGNIVEFRVDPGTGALTPTGADLKTSIPMCVVFVPAQ